MLTWLKSLFGNSDIKNMPTIEPQIKNHQNPIGSLGADSESYTPSHGWETSKDGSKTFFSADTAVGTLSADGKAYSVTTGVGEWETTTNYVATSTGDYGDVRYVDPDTGVEVDVPAADFIPNCD